MGTTLIERVRPWPIKGPAKAVLVGIAHFVSDETGVGWPGMPALALMLGLDRATVQRAVVKLREAGAVLVAAGHRGRFHYSIPTTLDQSHAETSRTPRPVAHCDQYPSHAATSTRRTLRPEHLITPNEHRVTDPLGNDTPRGDEAESVGPIFILKNGAGWRATKGQLTTWASAFPAIDQAQELAKAAAWCASNPEKSKTAKGMPRFINSWLSRAAERQMNSSGPALIEHLPTAAEAFALIDEDPAHV